MGRSLLEPVFYALEGSCGADFPYCFASAQDFEPCRQFLQYPTVSFGQNKPIPTFGTSDSGVQVVEAVVEVLRVTVFQCPEFRSSRVFEIADVAIHVLEHVADPRIREAYCLRFAVVGGSESNACHFGFEVLFRIGQVGQIVVHEPLHFFGAPSQVLFEPRSRKRKFRMALPLQLGFSGQAVSHDGFAFGPVEPCLIEYFRFGAEFRRKRFVDLVFPGIMGLQYRLAFGIGEFPPQ